LILSSSEEFFSAELADLVEDMEDTPAANYIPKPVATKKQLKL
jgi:hypothetical protein